MTRLIDADALEKEMCSGCEYSKSKYANCDDCAIANAPTIDAVEVVRCKDCEHYNSEANVAYIAYCPMEDGEHLKPTDYCSYGEKAEIDPVKHGKNISENGFLCSVCSFGDFGGFHGYEPNYCPNCGAKMDKE